MENTLPISESCLLKVKLAGFLLLFLSVNFSSFSQKNDTIFYGQEKVYLHTDKPEYYVGEDIWFKAYLVKSGTHSTETLSKTVYVELITPNDSIFERKTIKISNGGGHGDFKLSSQLETGSYTIRAYTNYMQNFDEAYFFRKTIIINSFKTVVDDAVVKGTSRPDVQFFPEGGYLVGDFLNQVGFKAVDSNGNGVDIKGALIDNLGNTISKFESSHLGMGVFQFIPKPDSGYKAKVVYKGEELIYDFPKIQLTGILMKVVEHQHDYSIYLQSSLPNGLQNLTVLGSQRNGVLFGSEIESKDNQSVIKVSKAILKEGIVQFTLFDENKKSMLERLAFYEPDTSGLNVAISSTKEEYQTRGLVELELLLDSEVIKTRQANMSIAVTDMSMIKTNKYGLDIKSQLLLNSELKGEIEQPGYYFYSDHVKRKEHLDILMITQGWRQFIIDDSPKNSAFMPEKGFKISGTVKEFYNHKKSGIAEVLLAYFNSEEMVYESMITDTDGRFTFKNIELADSTSVIIRAQKPNLKEGKKTKNSDKNFYIELDSFITPKTVVNPIFELSQNINREIISKPTDCLQLLFDLQKGAEQLDEVILEPVYITKKKEHNKKRFFYKNPSNTLDFDEFDFNGYNILTALRRVPGIIVSDSAVFMRGLRSIAGESRALIVFNGIPLGREIELVDGVQSTEVDFIDVLKGSKAATYGSSGGSGVILIYTKDGSEKPSKSQKYERKGIKNFIHPGYSVFRKFYEPKYTALNKDNEKLDCRSTIYWNPVLKFNNNDKIKVSFYAADIETTYRVDIQGMSSDGQIIKTETFLNIEK